MHHIFFFKCYFAHRKQLFICQKKCDTYRSQFIHRKTAWLCRRQGVASLHVTGILPIKARQHVLTVPSVEYDGFKNALESNSRLWCSVGFSFSLLKWLFNVMGRWKKTSRSIWTVSFSGQRELPSILLPYLSCEYLSVPPCWIFISLLDFIFHPVLRITLVKRSITERTEVFFLCFSFYPAKSRATETVMSTLFFACAFLEGITIRGVSVINCTSECFGNDVALYVKYSATLIVSYGE